MESQTGKYKSANRMSDLIQDDYRILQVMSRFGLSLGFGDKSVYEVCQNHQVDCDTFLAVVNFMQEENTQMHYNVEKLSIPSLLNYLEQAHDYFLDFYLPAIRRKLIEAIDCSSDNKIAFLILKFFDEYVGEVREHMEFENRFEFMYVNSLINGNIEEAETITHEVCPMKTLVNKSTNQTINKDAQTKEHSNILLFTRRHASQHKLMDRKLSELKNIIIKYYPSNGSNHLLNAVLYDIFSCEEEVGSHCRIEDYLFVPAVRCLEKKMGL